MRYEKPEIMVVVLDGEDVIRTSTLIKDDLGGGIEDPNERIEI